jgi:hypothetical protein
VSLLGAREGCVAALLDVDGLRKVVIAQAAPWKRFAVPQAVTLRYLRYALHATAATIVDEEEEVQRTADDT